MLASQSMFLVEYEIEKANVRNALPVGNMESICGFLYFSLNLKTSNCKTKTGLDS